MITARNEKSEDFASLVSIYDYANDPEAALYTLDRYEKVAERDQSTVGQRVKFLIALGNTNRLTRPCAPFAQNIPTI